MTASPVKTDPLKLGVTFHSFTHEFVSYAWSFEDLMVNASRLGGGVEIVGPVHHRKFPEVPQEFVTTFKSSVERNGLTPTCYGSYADPFMLWERNLGDDELVEYTIPQIKGAARLGFPIVRLQHFAAEIVERVLPLAERLGVKLGYELHSPLTLKAPRTIELVEQLQRIGSPHLGLIPDGGIFAQSVSAELAAKGLEVGLSEPDRDAVLELWGDDRPLEDAHALIDAAGGSSDAQAWAHRVWGAFGRSDPAGLRDIFEHVIHVHGKFYGLAGDDVADLRYRELTEVLVDSGYSGWISSEYEGPPADSFRMVAGQQAIIRRYEREHAESRAG